MVWMSAVRDLGLKEKINLLASFVMVGMTDFPTIHDELFHPTYPLSRKEGGLVKSNGCHLPPCLARNRSDIGYTGE